MVYLLNSQYSENQPESWLCGGVLISASKVLTAAACLTDVTHIYVIAGYRKYVNGKNILHDKCTRTRKQKIVKIIIPKEYTPKIWIKYDVGIGVVEKPYDFTDVSYRVICSYEPGSISINYNILLEAANTSAYALGWGGSQGRVPGFVGDINSEYLKEAQTIITNMSFCQTQFTKKVEYYFLCTNGNISATRASQLNIGNVSSTELPPDDCDKIMQRDDYNDTDISECFGDGEIPSRRRANRSEPLINGINNHNKKLNENTLDGNHTRRQDENFDGGICQNDHGGPLVTLVGETEILIGIALNSVYSHNYQCEGPFLYLSTARSGVLIKCLLAQTNEMRDLCGTMNNEIKEYDVIWPVDKSINRSSAVEVELEDDNQDFAVNERPLTMVRVRPQLQFINNKLNKKLN